MRGFRVKVDEDDIERLFQADRHGLWMHEDADGYLVVLDTKAEVLHDEAHDEGWPLIDLEEAVRRLGGPRIEVFEGIEERKEGV